jgi:hypothetical protein
MDFKKINLSSKDFESYRENPVIKYGLIVSGSLLLIFVSGHAFRIIAKSVEGYKMMVNAFRK